ncbi:conserved hypothetical protein [Vibrio parahaemolyticus]
MARSQYENQKLVSPVGVDGWDLGGQCASSGVRINAVSLHDDRCRVKILARHF